jgi:hypothetical protein
MKAYGAAATSGDREMNMCVGNLMSVVSMASIMVTSLVLVMSGAFVTMQITYLMFATHFQ